MDVLRLQYEMMTFGVAIDRKARDEMANDLQLELDGMEDYFEGVLNPEVIPGYRKRQRAKALGMVHQRSSAAYSMMYSAYLRSLAATREQGKQTTTPSIIKGR